MNNGIIYITYGVKYVKAAIFSAKSARQHNPNLAIHLFVDQKSCDELGLSADPSPFTSIGILENPHRRSKTDTMPKTPFDRTLYLDSDTEVAADITGLFEVLDKFDLAAVHAMRRNSDKRTEVWKQKPPASFPEFNTGVLLYKSSPKVFGLLEEWGRAFTEAGHHHDQPTFRELVWGSDLRIATLPPEYNVRYLKYKYLWDKTEAVPMIYHMKQYHIGWNVWYRQQAKDILFAVVGKVTSPILRFFGVKTLSQARQEKRIANRQPKAKKG